MSDFLTKWLPKSNPAKLAHQIEYNRYLMAAIAFAGVLAISLICVYLAPTSNLEISHSIPWIAISSLSLILLYKSGLYADEMSSSRTLLMVLLLIAHLFFVSVLHQLKNFPIGGYTVSEGQLMLVMPWMLAPAFVAILIGRRMGMFTALAVSMLGLSLLPNDSGIETQGNYLILSILTGTISAMRCARVRKRNQILYAGFFIGLTTFFCAFFLGCLHNATGDFNVKILILELIAAVGTSFFVAVVMGGALPMVEKMFNICTPMTWLELGDMNHVLLKRLQVEAPGTFHHSLQVSRLAEAAAEDVGANPTHCQVCALFHDVGKLENPHFFAENIQSGEINPHSELSPDMSIKIIIDHVSNGVELAKKEKLNSRITNVISEHHGTSMAYYFYRKALDHYEVQKKRFEEGLLDTCPEPVDKADFSYEGPLPQTKESGIISMADAVESATRSLRQPTEDQIEEIIEDIFKGRILDGHLNESGLSLGDLEKMKDSFLENIKSMNHNRIAYPKAKPEEEEAKDEEKASDDADALIAAADNTDTSEEDKPQKAQD